MLAFSSRNNPRASFLLLLPRKTLFVGMVGWGSLFAGLFLAKPRLGFFLWLLQRKSTFCWAGGGHILPAFSWRNHPRVPSPGFFVAHAKKNTFCWDGGSLFAGLFFAKPPGRPAWALVCCPRQQKTLFAGLGGVTFCWPFPRETTRVPGLGAVLLHLPTKKTLFARLARRGPGPGPGARGPGPEARGYSTK